MYITGPEQTNWTGLELRIWGTQKEFCFDSEKMNQGNKAKKTQKQKNSGKFDSLDNDLTKCVCIHHVF